MRSVLTRQVFRRLLTNEAFVFNCPQAAVRTHRLHVARTSIVCPRTTTGLTFGRIQRRTLFGFSRKPQREARTLDLDPGLSVLLDVSLMDKVGARPPEIPKLVDAWKAYFAHKEKRGESVNGVQAVHVLRTFRHLRDRSQDGKPMEDPLNTADATSGILSAGIQSLTLEDLMRAREIMLKIPTEDEGSLKEHNLFAREIFEEFSRRHVGTMLVVNEEQEGKVSDFRYFVEGLTLTGASIEARTHVEEYWLRERHEDKDKFRYKNGVRLWNILLRGLAREGNEAALVDAAMAAEDGGVPLRPAFHETMTTFYARRNDVEKTKVWYERELFGQRPELRKPTIKTVSEILQFCLRNDQMAWCTSVFKSILEASPDKPTWDVIFQWAAAGLGKGVEDVERMMEVMKKHNADNPLVKPDADTINGLVNFAMSKQDPYLAERYIQLGLKSGIYPNAKTYIMQMDYRIDAGDIPGAQEAYTSLQGQEIFSNEDVPVVNKYIQALCTSSKPNYDRIMDITSDLDERHARFAAPTVSSLCMLHLKRDDHQEVLDLLNTHVFHHSKSERASIRDAFLAFCFDRSNDTVRAWDAYGIMRQIFDETDITQRTALMNEFFARGRSDMATHVFGHMRQHIRPEVRPIASTYIACLEGIAAAADMESLDIVHNMMKMDSSIEPSTKIYNALMLAYTAAGEPYKALDFWTDITNSREGPNYRSLEIVFWVCEGKPFGDTNAKQIWERMRRMEIEITPDVFSAYIGALAGQACIEDCKSLIETSDTALGVVPDYMTIGTFYNAAPGQNRKDEVEEWARLQFPDLWAELYAIGRTEQDEGHFLFNIKRNTKA